MSQEAVPVVPMVTEAEVARWKEAHYSLRWLLRQFRQT
jgi:hypothetical protein